MKFDKPDIRMAQVYLDSGYQLIPLHRPDDMSDYKGKLKEDGKRPLHKNWTKKRYVNSDVLPLMAKGRNLGIRLKADQLVVDVDPRNMPDGRDTFKELCDEVGLDVSKYPVVVTGSGGLHVYMTKPPEVKLVDSLEDFPGVEFKSQGRQVVSAGSVHPTSGRHYEWDEFDYSEQALTGQEAAAPKSLIVLARRPTITTTDQGSGGEYDQEEIADMLEALDPEDFTDHDKWLSVMQAVHHASGGDARSEFIDWSTNDPKYIDDAWLIGRRWDSLSTNRAEGGMVTYRTLHKLMRDVGKGDLIIRPDDPDEDFGGDDAFDEDDDITEEERVERKSPLQQMNVDHVVVNDGGTTWVMSQNYDPVTERKYWDKWTRSSFNFYMANVKILVPGKDGEPVPKPIAEEWYAWSKRRTAKGVIFDPERDHEGYLNLWQGWNYEPKKGDWSMLKDLMLNVLCDGDQEAYDFVYRWIAYMIQYPSKPAEVAIAFHGAKGTGKSTLGNILCELAGGHGLAISSSEQLTGRFNSHLRDCLMLFSDEAINPYDKASESKLKTLITERWIAVEAKGVDIKPYRNHTHLMLASNEEWFIPASFGDGERRFFVSKVNTQRQGDTRFFDALHRQMRSGGYEGMLYELSAFDLGDWVPRSNIPESEALAAQQFRNMKPMQQWWFSLLNAGDMSVMDGADCEPIRIGANENSLKPVGTHGERNGTWASGSWIDVARTDVRTSFEMYCRSANINPGASGRALETMFAQELRRVCPSIPARQIRAPIPEERYDLWNDAQGRTVVYRIPPLGQCRQEFEAVAGFSVPWEDEEYLDEDLNDFG